MGCTREISALQLKASLELSRLVSTGSNHQTFESEANHSTRHIYLEALSRWIQVGEL